MNMNKIVKEVLCYAFIIVLVLLFKHYVMSPIRVDGDSMNPTLKDGDIMLLNEIGYRLKFCFWENNTWYGLIMSTQVWYKIHI